jgi:hypothetical protein
MMANAISDRQQCDPRICRRHCDRDTVTVRSRGLENGFGVVETGTAAFPEAKGVDAFLVQSDQKGRRCQAAHDLYTQSGYREGKAE